MEQSRIIHGRTGSGLPCDTQISYSTDHRSPASPASSPSWFSQDDVPELRHWSFLASAVSVMVIVTAPRHIPPGHCTHGPPMNLQRWSRLLGTLAWSYPCIPRFEAYNQTSKSSDD
jgi:hypothetical protein